jgi:hypothetical protein
VLGRDPQPRQSMKLRQAIPMGAIMVLISFGCGGDTVVNGFATYGSGKLQGFVTSTDGAPVAGASVGASFGPGAFGHSVQTDARGLYELEATSYQELDQSPFTDSLIQCRITVGQSLADTLIPVRFAPPGQAAVPVTVNFVVPAP